jgi:hypothetical protein
LQNPPQADMLGLSMNGTYDARNRWVDKIAFFSLFIAVLLIARFMVVLRSAILLSEPIELDCADLSVCIPIGNGWQSEKQWKYQQNAFILDSFFNPSRGGAAAVVSCQYLLAASRIAPSELFEEKISEVSGSKIAKTGQIEMGVSTLNWAHIKSLPGGSEGAKTLFDMFFGVVELPNSRRLDIEVYQDTADTELAGKIFKSVTEGLRFTDNQRLEAGSKIIAEIKNKGLDGFLSSPTEEWNEENFFLIKDARERTIGFAMELLGFLEPGQFEAGSFCYIRGRYDQAQTAFFQSDDSFNEFAWKSETSNPGGRRGAEMVLSKEGIMTVKEFNRRAKEKDYQIGPAAIPDVLSDFVFSQMIDSNQKEIFVDIIEDDGKIRPTLVSRIEASRAFTSQNRNWAEITGEQAAYVFEVELLDGRGFSQQVYLDGRRRVLKRLLQQESVYTLERTTAEDILREFPEQGSYILQSPMDSLWRKDKILEQNQLQESSER